MKILERLSFLILSIIIQTILLIPRLAIMIVDIASSILNIIKRTLKCFIEQIIKEIQKIESYGRKEEIERNAQR